MSVAVLRRIESWKEAVRLSVDRRGGPCGQDDPFHPGAICEQPRDHDGRHRNSHFSWIEGDWTDREWKTRARRGA